MSRKRTNITIDPNLHETAKTHARSVHGTDFSGLVTKLLVADLGDAYLQKNLGSKADEVISLLRRISSQEDARMSFGPRAEKGDGLKSAAGVLAHAKRHAKQANRDPKKDSPAARRRRPSGKA